MFKGEFTIPGSSETNEAAERTVEYPFEYIDAQICFAHKWSELSSEPFEKTLLEKTALYKVLTNSKLNQETIIPVWNQFIVNIQSIETIQQISAEAYLTYLSQPHSEYCPPEYPDDDGKHFGYFSFDHYPANSATGEKDRIKVHFINKHRGEKSGLDPSYLQQRQADLQRMFEHIKQQYPQAEEVIGGSWLYVLPGYRDSFPTEFTGNMKRLVPKGFEHIPNSVPNMSFGGNSVWGQFVDRRGGVRKQVFYEFKQNIENSRTLTDLVDSFPNKTYQPKVSISVFYDWIASRSA